MSEPIVCKRCGATSYNDPGKTALYCDGCFSAAEARVENLQAQLDLLKTHPTDTFIKWMAEKNRNAELEARAEAAEVRVDEMCQAYDVIRAKLAAAEVNTNMWKQSSERGDEAWSKMHEAYCLLEAENQRLREALVNVRRYVWNVYLNTGVKGESLKGLLEDMDAALQGREK